MTEIGARLFEDRGVVKVHTWEYDGKCAKGMIRPLNIGG